MCKTHVFMADKNEYKKRIADALLEEKLDAMGASNQKYRKVSQ